MAYRIIFLGRISNGLLSETTGNKKTAGRWCGLRSVAPFGEIRCLRIQITLRQSNLVAKNSAGTNRLHLMYSRSPP